MEENFPNLKREMPTHEYTKSLQNSKQTGPQQNYLLSHNTQNPNVLNKERILRAVREKGQVTYKGRPIRITPDFSPETMKARRSWADLMQTLRNTNAS